MDTARTYSPAQTAYLVARAAVDTIRAEVKATAPAEPAADCDIDTFDAWCDAVAEIEIAANLGRYESALMDAEQALVEWSLTTALKTAPGRADAAEAVAVCLDKGMRRPGPRAKLIDLAMRLAA